MSGEWQQTFVDFPEGTRIQDRLSHRHRGIVESVVLVPLYTVRFYGHKDSEIVDWWTLRAAPPVKCSHEGGMWQGLDKCADCQLPLN